MKSLDIGLLTCILLVKSDISITNITRFEVRYASLERFIPSSSMISTSFEGIVSNERNPAVSLKIHDIPPRSNLTSTISLE